MTIQVEWQYAAVHKTSGSQSDRACAVLRGYCLRGWRTERMGDELTGGSEVGLGVARPDLLEHLQDLPDVALLGTGLGLQARR
jgi:hypothetical protein